MDRYRTESKYWYPGTETLINKLNEKDPKRLEELETGITQKRLSELYKKPLHGSFGMKHLQKIHKYIFQDIYPFAGEYREELIQKGTTTFAAPLHIHTNGFELLNKQLKNENFLKGLNKDEFSKRMSYYMGEINLLHPFREGNGRTQREYFRTLGLKNGYEIDWTKIDKETMLKASIRSVLDENAFVEIFHNSIVNDKPDKDLIKQFVKLNRKNNLEL